MAMVVTTTSFCKMENGYGFGQSLYNIPNWNAIVETIKDNEDFIESRRSSIEGGLAASELFI